MSFHTRLVNECKGVISGEEDLIANAANVAAVLFELMNKWKGGTVNWAGFYFMRKGVLVLGPFQGKSACIRIPIDKGVCGAAASTMKSQHVSDVHKFPGHIACDSGSNSEVVVPLLVDDRCVGVLDLDSLIVDGFDDDDRNALEEIAAHFSSTQAWKQIEY